MNRWSNLQVWFSSQRLSEKSSKFNLSGDALQDTIGEHLLEVDKAARKREGVILKQLEEKEPLPDKEKDQMAWVRAANQHRAIAEEIILKELIYVLMLLVNNLADN